MSTPRDYDHILSLLGSSEKKASPVVVEPYTVEVFAALALAFGSSLPTIYATGDPEKIIPHVESSGVDPDAIRIIPAMDSDTAVAEAAALVRDRRARFIVKGSVTSSQLLRGVLGSSGLGTASVASHLYLIEAPAFGDRLVAFADAGVNISPTLNTKAAIIMNSTKVLEALALDRPKVAVLSAMEHVKSSVPSSMDAAMLVQMGRRRQLGDVLIDGPLSMDTALNPAAAAAKGLSGPVAGQAELLLAPDLDAANMTSKALIGTCGRAMAVVLGATVPIAFPSRGDNLRTRTDSLRLAAHLSTLPQFSVCSSVTN